MSIGGALLSGLTGLSAQGQALAIESDNIANANTVGYKGTQAQFSTLVTASPSQNIYNSGGVNGTVKSLIDQQGLIQASNSATDIAINGRGFFAVASSVNNSGTVPLGVSQLYTRAGSFAVNQQGFLINNSGNFLLGTAVAPGAALPAAPGALNSPPAISVGRITGNPAPTPNLHNGAHPPATAPPQSPRLPRSLGHHAAGP